MGWEKRNGSRYYYNKRREGGRVVSRYVGTGLGAQLAEAINEEQKLERQYLRLEIQSERELDREIDARIREAERAVRLLMSATMIAAGYHQHKGQWRRKRGGIGKAEGREE